MRVPGAGTGGLVPPPAPAPMTSVSSDKSLFFHKLHYPRLENRGFGELTCARCSIRRSPSLVSLGHELLPPRVPDGTNARRSTALLSVRSKPLTRKEPGLLETTSRLREGLQAVARPVPEPDSAWTRSQAPPAGESRMGTRRPPSISSPAF